ncbi:MAG: DMT family transporter [Microscillaceae bacterium]|nr:DMT family transporter [Microscillaceae bacterium]
MKAQTLLKFTWNSPQYTIIIGVGLAFCGAIAFSLKAIFVKLIYLESDIDAYKLVALRMLFALPIYLIVAWLQHRRVSPSLSHKDWYNMALMGFLGYHLASTFDFIGLKYVSAGMERLILFSYPTIVLLIAAWIYKKKITYIQYISLILTYLGIGFAYIGDLHMHQGTHILMGSMYVFGAAVSFAIYMIGSGTLIPRFGVLRYNAYTMVIASLTVIIQAAIQSPGDWFTYSPKVYYLTFAMSFFSTVIPTFLVTAGISRIGASNASLISSVGPISTIILADIFLDEIIGLNQVIGTALVMAGVMIISLMTKTK